MPDDTPDPTDSRSTSAELRATAAQLRVQAQVSVHLARLARWDTAVRLMRLTLARLRRERRVG